MSSEYVYILSTYGEYGAEGVVATLDRNALLPLLRKQFGAHFVEIERECGVLEKLLLLHDDAYLAEKTDHTQQIDLSKGWGGVQLHVVKLAHAETPAPS